MTKTWIAGETIQESLSSCKSLNGPWPSHPRFALFDSRFVQTTNHSESMRVCSFAKWQLEILLTYCTSYGFFNVNINVHHWLIILWCVCGCFPVAGLCQKKCPGDAVADSNDLGATKLFLASGIKLGGENWSPKMVKICQNADGLRLTMTMTKISNPWPNAHIESPRT